ncbi:helix-turn-helix transcriptional regulator [Micromonospora tulbaghiae]|uniref:helix-turn-helix transcriptional regulator n=1 Tax=Micromonospora TaxID=1873 RepID=UPI00207D6DFE|nr:WYL domain-containing protein [Micromonospora sp. CPM1]MCO1614586.1 WYL domain-containing protein [Micromonospora sp. CPM1]
MDTPSSRSLRLLSLLQSGREWSTGELASRLQVSERTVRRDARRLRDLGYDVRSRPGPGAGYRLRPSVRIPPPLLSSDEVSTIITSLLVMEAWMPDDTAASTARAKLQQVLPPGLRHRAEATANSTRILHQDPAPLDWTLAGSLTDAVAAGARVHFHYVDQHGHESRRTVQPYRHLLRRRHWYLVGYDIDRDGWRTFRLDRIRTISTVPGPYRPRAFPFDSIDHWLGSDFGRGGGPSTPAPAGAPGRRTPPATGHRG